ncbi:4490_t:CDS:2 [Ambispora leptoticha]|uniref:4490_t:CDS:1 n=1 Tax=Ambispora leptoticha TaxID=144679 RepID=A0A9N9BLW3_9GLOM|nr:4490_t:CDS:2 [Ambispora leptoticha]
MTGTLLFGFTHFMSFEKVLDEEKTEVDDQVSNFLQKNWKEAILSNLPQIFTHSI